ncbi:helix-turn-helix domain-containing protein [Kovacikia minuta CCNUW1]|uniref:PucR family transcriptional regulator n=1 Tax=Kovacikia minuta TaxID=2931930 RepID=UPI001CCDA16C|nr:helix-turn-helix domain-containing protein [Kovacikia minuta]UBF26529.1 helix-turn-helix domain-containing protein [Kovacikia minuta CCNUW1]
MSRQFKQVAGTIAEHLSQLLSAQVSVVDAEDAIVATSASKLDAVASLSNLTPNSAFIRVPIYLDGQVGAVLIAKSVTGEILSPRPAQKLVELMVNQAANISQCSEQHELKNKFIHDLLHGSNSNEIKLLREGQILGMDLTRPRAVILIDAANYILSMTDLGAFDPSAQIWRRAQLVISSVVNFFHLPNDTICAYIGDGEIAVLKASSTQDLAAWITQEDEPSPIDSSWANLTALKRAGMALLQRLRSDTHTTIDIGIGRYHPTLRGLAHSYQDARAALSLGKRFCGQNRVHCLDSLGIAAFVGISNERTKVDLAKYLLSPLDQESELLETLDVFFFENCCLSSTANRLSIHRNTLSYRLEKITSLTGLNPRRFEDAMQIRLALFLRSLQADTNHLCKCPIAKRWDQQYLRQTSDELFGESIHYRKVTESN